MTFRVGFLNRTKRYRVFHYLAFYGIAAVLIVGFFTWRYFAGFSRPSPLLHYKLPYDDKLPAAAGGCPTNRSLLGYSQNTEPLRIHCNLGRLGNQMCTLATLYGLSFLNNRNYSLLPCNFNKLDPFFEIKAPVTNMSVFTERNPHIIASVLNSKDLCIDPNSNIIKGYLYPCSYPFFHHVREDIKKIFRFKQHIKEFAQRTLRDLSLNKTNVTFVGVHVRRTDYLVSTQFVPWLKAFDGREVDMEYFQKATQYYRDRYKNVIFVAVSDDREWCKLHLPKFGIQITPEAPSPAHDMCILSQCNHTIMTYGTFGFWGGYLSGGEVVYFDKFLKPNTEFTKKEFIKEFMYLPEWVGIATKNQW